MDRFVILSAEVLNLQSSIVIFLFNGMKVILIIKRYL